MKPSERIEEIEIATKTGLPSVDLMGKICALINYLDEYKQNKTIKIKKGQWFTYCCELDLQQADNDLEVDFDDLPRPIGPWNSKEEAMLKLKQGE